jgi:hypothetical protein
MRINRDRAVARTQENPVGQAVGSVCWQVTVLCELMRQHDPRAGLGRQDSSSMRDDVDKACSSNKAVKVCGCMKI